MSGVHDDLATLREVVRSDEAGWDGGPALDRVETELARLRESLTSRTAHWESANAKLRDQETELARLREELADAEKEAQQHYEEHILVSTHSAIVGRMERELARLRALPQTIIYDRADDYTHRHWKKRAETAERELARLRENLDAMDKDRARVIQDLFRTRDRKQAAERELVRLQDGMRLTHEFARERLEDGHPGLLDMHLVEDKLRALLAEDGAE